ncbi:unnamed protein product [Lasius platythorax]|uniref:Retrotransposon gag domain-containing protein n=1 Tax=Lasius platythorax TaxID=488582 RepID=A0AAV2NNR3_9HYME
MSQAGTLVRGRSGSSGSAQSRLKGGNVVKVISPQIPIFEGYEKDNIRKWLEQVDYVEGLHEINENILLLAATSRLAGNALDWYNRQSTAVISSWAEVKKGLLEYFQRKVSFMLAMSKINKRVWLHTKEKFVDYVNNKLNLMQFLDLSEREQIDLIAAGIKLPMIQVAAMDARLEKLSDFVKHMRRVTEVTVITFSI